MINKDTHTTSRILVIDDNPGFHEEIQTILRQVMLPLQEFNSLDADLFDGDSNFDNIQASPSIDAALSGQEGVSKIQHAIERQEHYIIVFVELRMSNGWNGLDTLEQIWRLSPNIQVILCTADETFSWDEIQTRFSHSQYLLFLKKPVNAIEVRQMVDTFFYRWQRVKHYFDRHQLAYQNHIDYLTGLPNRGKLIAHLSQHLSTCHLTPTYSALLLIDLNQFKKFNEVFGQTRGNVVLQELAMLLPSWIRSQDTLAHLGGDVFALFLQNFCTDEKVANAVALRRANAISFELSSRTMWADVNCAISASIGITVFGNEPLSSDDVLNQAEFALREAKAAGEKTVRLFNPTQQAVIAENVWLSNVLQGAVANKELELHYQPQLNLKHELIGCEALLRWTCPGRGPVSPVTFIPLAEETGLIIEIGNWVLESACQTLAKWSTQAHMAQLVMAINISAAQIQMPNFVELILTALSRHGVQAERLYLELTESVLVNDLSDITNKMQQLKAHGIRISLDDFGTGFSSLTYLKHLPFDQIKLDRSFVADVLTDASAAIIARSVIALSQALGLHVVGEGVETNEQLTFLTENGCDELQGYLFSKPVTESRFNDFVLAWNPKNSLLAA